MTVDFNDPASVIAAYNAQYPIDVDQGPSGICVAASWIQAIQGLSLFVYKTPVPRLAAQFAYYMASGDDTFFHGFDPLAMGARLQDHGCCIDELYPQARWLANWQNAGSYRPQDLPGPECYADARTRLLLRIGWLRTSFEAVDYTTDMVRMLRMGYPVVYGTYSHSMTVLAVSPDNYWFYVKDSELANQNMYGAGRGIRILSRESFVWTPFYPLEIQIPSITVIPPVLIIPPGDTLATQADVIAAIRTVGPWDSATYARLQAAVGAAMPVAPPVITPPVTTTPPATTPPATTPGVTYLAAGAELIDTFGIHWTLSADVDPRYGPQLLCNGRGLRRTKQAALVNGKLRCVDLGIWYEFSGGDAYAPVWSQVSAP